METQPQAGQEKVAQIGVHSVPSLALGDIGRKLRRANEHLEALRAMQSSLRHTRYKLVPEQDADPNFIAFRIALPAIPSDCDLVIGDCLHNTRCVLDHIVWQMAHRHSPNRTDQERKRNMFPICGSPGEFAHQVKRNRLNGTPRAAETLIERLQPYPSRNQDLLVLNELENIDKHRRLTVVASGTLGIFSDYFRQLGLHIPLWGDGFYDGAIAFRADSRVIPASLGDFGKVNVEANGTVHILFGDPPAEGWIVESFLERLLYFVEQAIFPAFQPFFN